MSNPPYLKPHISYQEQVNKLLERGMIIEDKARAIQTLEHINYYRLGVYWHSFEVDHKTHRFKPGTRFEDVVSLYDFDRQLRLLVLDAIERFEVSARTQWTYHLSDAYGPHAHLVAKAHSNNWSKTVEDLQKEIKRSDEIFIKKILSKYDGNSPPIWAVSEIMSFGLLSKWYKNLRVNTLRKNIARVYDVHPDVLQSWMQHFTVLRNNCAHHSRLWNRQFGRVAPMQPKYHQVLDERQFVPDHPLGNSLVILLYLLDIISPKHSWRARFIALTEDFPRVKLQEMGLGKDWRNLAIWHDTELL